MKRTYCNPINIPYQYQHYGKCAHREAADPTLLFYKGRYYLYASMSEGFYDSDDLLHWRYHKNENLDKYRYAPDVREVNGKMIFCASTRGKPSTFWRTDDPFSKNMRRSVSPSISGTRTCFRTTTDGFTCTGDATAGARSTASSSIPKS